MKKLSVEDLARKREEIRSTMDLQEKNCRAKVTIHMGTCGIASGANEIMKALLDEINDRNLHNILVNTSGCAGLCSREPMVTVKLKNESPVKYIDLTPDKIREILNKHILNGKVVKEYALAVGSESVE